MRRFPAALALALALAGGALLAGCGRPLLSAQLEISEIRIVEPAIFFPSAAAAVPADLCAGVAGCVTTDLSYDLGAEVPGVGEKGFTVDLRLTDVAIRLTVDPSGASTTAPPDLGGITSMRVLVDTPAGPTTVASYAKPLGGTPSTVTVSGNSNVDLSSNLSGGKIGFRIEVSYDLASPPPSFFADVEAGFSLVATVDYRDAFL